LSGTKPYFFSSLRINFSAARLLRLIWTMHIGMLDKSIVRCYRFKHGYNFPNEPSKVSTCIPG
jgi:hypothetical protein